MSGPSGANTQTASVRCVLYHAADGELPGELLNSLSKRVGRMLVCTDPYAALAEACLIERECRAATGRPGTPAQAMGILLLVHPQSLAMAAELIEAAKLYAPGVSRWCYERSANPRLRAIVESDMARWTLPAPISAARAGEPGTRSAAPQAAPERPGSDAGPAPRLAVVRRPVTTVQTGASVIAGPNISPRLRLSGIEHTSQDRTLSLPANPPETESSPETRERTVRPRPLLTEQELRMLLSDDPIGGNGANGDDRNGVHHESPQTGKGSTARPATPPQEKH